MRELEADLGVPKDPMSQSLTKDLGMKCVVAKFILWLLLPEQKEHHAAVANDLIQTATDPDFPTKVVTRDESWLCGEDLEMKFQLPQWKFLGSPCQKQAHKVAVRSRPC